LKKGCSYNPLRINLEPWVGLAKDLMSARSVSEA
jgi:hypothetical protein